MNMKLAAFIPVVAVSMAFGQSAPKPPAFEVATVKLSTPDEAGPGDIPRNMNASPGQFAMKNVPLRYAIEWAYELKDYEISGPEWIKSDMRYDITAKAAGPVAEDQIRLMLRTLLAERFQMKVHRESRELPVYVLLPGKGVAKVKAAGADETTGLSGSPAGAVFTKQPISRLTFLLTRRMDRPALDMTGLVGLYDFTLDLSGLNPSGVTPEGTPEASIFTAIQNNLGLKLEPRKQAIEMLIIDQVNKIPTAN